MVRRAFQIVVLTFLSLWACAQIPSSAQTVPSLSLRKIRFENITIFSPEEQRSLAEQFQQRLVQISDNPGAQPASSADALKQAVLSAYQEKGYWRARVDAQSADSEIVIRAIEEGPLYSLKEVRWAGVTVFPEEELRQQIPIQTGDALDRARIITGLAEIQKLYQSRGYKDCVATPELEFDEASHSAILQIAVEEDSLLRFRNLTIAGLEGPQAEKLERQWERLRGEAYSPDKLRSFLQKSLRTRPGIDPLDFSASDVDLDSHSVDVRITFLPKPTQADANTPKE